MLNEKILLQTLKTNFEKLNKTKLSDFENDLYSVKRVPFLTITKDDLQKYTTYEGRMEVTLFYGYEQTPKIDWLQNSNYIRYHLKMEDITGNYIDQTEIEQPFNYEKMSIAKYKGYDESDLPSDSPLLSQIDIITIPNMQSAIRIINGADIVVQMPKDAFHVQVFLNTSLFEQCAYFELELYKIEYKKIPLENLGIDEIKKLPANYIDLTSLDKKFAPITNPKFINTVRIGEHKNLEDFENEIEFGFCYGENSLSVGKYAQSPGYCSFSQGENTVALNNFQHVIGRYNKTEYENGYGVLESTDRDNSDMAFIIGNGFSGDKRSNAHMINFSGDAWYAGNVYIGKDLDKSERLITEKEARNYITQPVNSICLVDSSTGYEHIIQFMNGKLVSFVKTISIIVKTQPIKTDYSDTDEFDATGMEISAICQDGSERDITDYVIYDEYVTINSTVHKIIYRENGNEYITTVPVTTRTLEQALVDFEYIINNDGTYTLTEWKQTLNGNPSQDKLILPNSKIIRL